jgi:hypothetical protein
MYKEFAELQEKAAALVRWVEAVVPGKRLQTEYEGKTGSDLLAELTKELK